MEKKIDVLPTNSSKESPAQIYVSSSHKARGLGCIIPLVLSTLLCCLLLWRR